MCTTLGRTYRRADIADSSLSPLPRPQVSLLHGCILPLLSIVNTYQLFPCSQIDQGKSGCRKQPLPNLSLSCAHASLLSPLSSLSSPFLPSPLLSFVRMGPGTENGRQQRKRARKDPHREYILQHWTPRMRAAPDRLITHLDKPIDPHLIFYIFPK